MIARVVIDGEIGEDTTLKTVRNQVGSYSTVDGVELLINSQGGEVDEGFAIHDYIRSLNVPVTSKVVGKCYSIATVIFLAGDKKELSDNSTFMIHNPWGQPNAGDAEEIENYAKFLREAEDRIANFYAKKTGLDLSKIVEMMKKKTFMNRDEAKRLNFSNHQSEYKAVAKFKIDKMDDKEQSVLASAINKLSDKVGKLFASEEGGAKSLLLEADPELGYNIFVETEDGEVVGKAVFKANESGESTGEALEDGTYMIADGRAIVVADGMIAEVQEARSPAEAEEEEDEELKNAKARIEELEAQNAELLDSVKAKEEEVEGVKASLEEVKTDLEGIKALSIGSGISAKQRKPVSVSNATDLDKMFFNFINK